MQRAGERERAKSALEAIKGIEKSNPAKYVSYISSLPATIVVNGLGQALAMLLAKSKTKATQRQCDTHRQIYRHLVEWLNREDGGDRPDYMNKLMSMSEEEYILAQEEALLYTHWLKQFSRAYLEGDDSSADSDRRASHG